uniref:Uncharacterized protein n=1 Tax=Anguilla anguilla TaxID=7936 RepID=A0A0E9S1Q8_ANGAN
MCQGWLQPASSLHVLNHRGAPNEDKEGRPQQLGHARLDVALKHFSPAVGTSLLYSWLCRVHVVHVIELCLRFCHRHPTSAVVD